ncbi:trypsin-like peptidase domain-containing protein [Granulicoccus sp. GXG6511]|uniref:trypsin-like peptidase domain-containing protein n=1 Tax=Granulicoccus sp. GXG6511 TaxID=3381351 RepID=UPI003D7C5BD9
MIALVTGIFVLAIVAGVAVAFVIRAAGGAGLAALPGSPPSPGSPAAPVQSVSPEPLETPEGPSDGPFAEVAHRAASGTHRILATTCTGTGVGTAFQFGSEGLLVTSARAVSGARSIAVLSGDRIVPADVAKIDTVSGLALLRPDVAMVGQGFELGTQQLAVGDQVALLGWTTESQQPARGRARIGVGTITEAGLTLESPDGRHPGIRRMTGEFDPGLAGSPVVGEDGRLLGVVLQAADDQDDLVVAGLDTVADPLLGPTGMPPAMEPCLNATGPRIVTTVGGAAPAALRTQLGQWFGALNAGDWDRARGTLTGGLREDWTREELDVEHRGTYAFNIVSAPSDSGAVTVSWARLQAEGDPACERLVADVALDESGIRSISPRGAPVPCG